jgi:superfamily II DNA or RNA helicase
MGRTPEYFLSSLEKNEYVVRESIYLPKTCGLSSQPLKASLTFNYRDNYKQYSISHFNENATHFIVPRYYPLPKRFLKNIKDVRPPMFKFDRQLSSWAIEPRDEKQKEALDALMLSNKGTLIMSCGSGKTVCAIDYLNKKQTPTLIIVNNSTLFEQWTGNLKTFLGYDDLGVIKSGVIDWQKPIVLATIQTLAKLGREVPYDMRKWFGLVIWDEVDEMATPKYSATADMFFGQRLGITATRKRADGMEKIYEYHMGLPIYEDYSQKLTPKVIFLKTNITIDLDFNAPGGYSNMVTALSSDDLRNDKIFNVLNILVASGRKTLVLSERIEQLEYFHKQYPESGLCISDVTPSDRKDALKESNLIFAIRQLAKRGLDQPDLDTVVMLTPLKDESNLRQIAGRVLREESTKQTPIVIIIDDTRVIPIHAVCNKSYRVFDSFGYPIERMDIDEFRADSLRAEKNQCTL